MMKTCVCLLPVSGMVNAVTWRMGIRHVHVYMKALIAGNVRGICAMFLCEIKIKTGKFNLFIYFFFWFIDWYDLSIIRLQPTLCYEEAKPGGYPLPSAIC